MQHPSKLVFSAVNALAPVNVPSCSCADAETEINPETNAKNIARDPVSGKTSPNTSETLAPKNTEEINGPSYICCCGNSPAGRSEATGEMAEGPPQVERGCCTTATGSEITDIMQPLGLANKETISGEETPIGKERTDIFR